MINEINIALVGASGVVGGKIISLLEKKNLSINNFYPLGFSSVGKEISLNHKNFIIEDIANFDCTKANLVIFSAGSDFINTGKIFETNNGPMSFYQTDRCLFHTHKTGCDKFLLTVSITFLPFGCMSEKKHVM